LGDDEKEIRKVSNFEDMVLTFCIVALKCFFFSNKSISKLENGAHLLHHLLEMVLLHPTVRILSNKPISKLENGAHLLHHLLGMLLHPNIRILSNKSIKVLP
jgi:hypothetical protein